MLQTPDSGSNGLITYSLSNTKGSAGNIFTIDENTGTVSVSGQIDYEKDRKYEVRVEAKDQGGLIGTSKVIVDVVDVNDNAPVINIMSFSSPVSENAPTGTTIAILNIKDADSDNNGKIRCSIDGKLPFKIESSLTNYYNLISDQHFDRESVSEYNITITATDLGSPPLTSSTKLHLKISDVILENPIELHRVTVEVLDINDHAPVFPNKDTAIGFEISESAAVGVQFPLQSAEDLDVAQNALQDYMLSPNDNFILKQHANPDGGKYVEMVLQKPLDREKHPRMSLKLIAVDGGTPQRSGTVNIDITVLDANDNAPVFNQSSVYKATVMENAATGTNIVTVNATDADSGSNGYITYSISNVRSNIADLLSIDEKSGVLSVSGPIDFEKDTKYELRIDAKDQGGLTDSSKVIIEVSDVNDNAPTVSVMSFTSHVSEDSPPGTTIGIINVKDLDSGENGQVTCKIEQNAPFKIKSNVINWRLTLVTRGAFRQRGRLQYNITVTCSDEGVPSLSAASLHFTDL
ncbi:hypothetical protein FQN60_010275 [Etheostoma spectabile]|uniref:Cadherin domain-containing protein n=1 Tax=Etheostoma spectabile TaxID=54343 RepID=A0A5J5D7L4_9PERO|nr:hypothetical protein FQN60_010275 [Etheostoma spectabile]